MVSSKESYHKCICDICQCVSLGEHWMPLAFSSPTARMRYACKGGYHVWILGSEEGDERKAFFKKTACSFWGILNTIFHSSVIGQVKTIERSRGFLLSTCPSKQRAGEVLSESSARNICGKDKDCCVLVSEAENERKCHRWLSHLWHSVEAGWICRRKLNQC